MIVRYFDTDTAVFQYGKCVHRRKPKDERLVLDCDKCLEMARRAGAVENVCDTSDVKGAPSPLARL